MPLRVNRTRFLLRNINGFWGVVHNINDTLGECFAEYRGVTRELSLRVEHANG